MATTLTISSPGLDTNNPDAGRIKMYLTLFGGEVLTAYRRNSVTLGRHMERTIPNGKAANFPVLGRKVAQYLTPGNSLDDIRRAEQQTEVAIKIDGLLTADSLITDLDDFMNHYDVRREYAYQIGEALAMARDGGILAEIAKASLLTEELLPGLGKGKVVTRTIEGGMATESEALGKAIISMLLEVKTAMSKNYVPNDGRVCYMLPVGVNALVASKDAINRDFGAQASIIDANVVRIAGIDVVECPHLTVGGVTKVDNGTPDGLIQGVGHAFPTEYKDKCIFLVAHRSTVGTLVLKSFAIEHGRRIDYQADQIVGKYAMGHGMLRPEAAFMGTIEASPEA